MITDGPAAPMRVAVVLREKGLLVVAVEVAPGWLCSVPQRPFFDYRDSQ